MMSDVIRQETTVFFLAIALGAGLSFFYDFLRVLRRMIRGYIETRTGKAWQPEGPARVSASTRRRGCRRA